MFLNYKTSKELKDLIKIKNRHTHKLITDKIDSLDMDNADGYSFEVGAYIFIIVKSFKNTPFSHNILQHEITHAVFLSGDYIGIEYNKANEEYYAYMSGFITQQIHSKLK